MREKNERHKPSEVGGSIYRVKLPIAKNGSNNLNKSGMITNSFKKHLNKKKLFA